MENITNFRHFGTMIDCSRNAVMTLPTLKKWVDPTSSMGYNSVLLYMEDTYEVDDNLYFGHGRLANPHKYLLYNDLFSGKMDGRIDRIEELEEPVLEYFGNGEEPIREDTDLNSFKKIFTSNTLTW